MKIKDVKAVALNTPLERTFKGGTYQHDNRGTILTTIETDEGIVGQSFIGQNRTKIPEQKQICDIINQTYKKELIGKDPFMIKHIWGELYKFTIERKFQVFGWDALACVDVTLYDLIGKALNTPLFRLLGGSKNKIPLISVKYYIEQEDFSKQLEDLRNETRRVQKDGFYGIKLKVGALDIDKDIERVKTVREEAGDNFLICCDANSAWTPEEAISFAEKAEKYSIAYFEEPVHWFNEKRGLKKVKDSINIPVSACQGVKSREECFEYIDKECVDMVNQDISRIGGMTEWLYIANYAYLNDIGITAHANIETTLQLFGAIPNSTWATQQTVGREPFWSGGLIAKNKPEVKNGYIHLSNKPGLGFDIDLEAAKSVQVYP
jgi:D-arabinonate dehydratase